MSQLIEWKGAIPILRRGKKVFIASMTIQQRQHEARWLLGGFEVGTSSLEVAEVVELMPKVKEVEQQIADESARKPKSALPSGPKFQVKIGFFKQGSCSVFELWEQLLADHSNFGERMHRLAGLFSGPQLNLPQLKGILRNQPNGEEGLLPTDGTKVLVFVGDQPQQLVAGSYRRPVLFYVQWHPEGWILEGLSFMEAWEQSVSEGVYVLGCVHPV